MNENFEKFQLLISISGIEYCRSEESSPSVLFFCHLDKYKKWIKKDIYDSIEIAKRWKLDYTQCLKLDELETNQKIEYEEPKLDTTDQKDRFSILRSHPIALSSLAVKDQESCQIMKEAFDMAEEGLKNLYKEPTIVDEFGSRCGKHKGKR